MLEYTTEYNQIICGSLEEYIDIVEHYEECILESYEPYHYEQDETLVCGETL